MADFVKQVVFVVTPAAELDDDLMEPPLGILYLATILKQQGISCAICDLSGLPEEKWLGNLVTGDIYAFSTYSVTYPRTLKIRDLVKSRLNSNATIVAGGPHASALPDECISDFDIVITGEAEQTFLEIVLKIRGGENPRGIFRGIPVQELDIIPFPDYGLVDIKRYHRIVEGKSSFSILSTRGCPFKCPYCNSRVSNRGKFRLRSPENVVQEIRQLMFRYGVTNFRFGDDLFTLSHERTREMAAALRPLHIFYRVFGQAQTLDPQVCSLLDWSGCRHVSIGIETMSDIMMKNLQKHSTVDDNIAALENCRKAGLKTRIYLMVGFPGETEETVKESLKVLIDCPFDEFIVYSFIPYPGTPVWHNPEQWGITKMDRDFSRYVQVGRSRSTCFAITTKDFTPDDVRRWRAMTIEELEKNGFLWAGKSPDNR